MAVRFELLSALNTISSKAIAWRSEDAESYKKLREFILQNTKEPQIPYLQRKEDVKRE